MPVPDFGDGTLLGLDRAGGGLGVQGVGLAPSAPRLAVGAVDLDHDLAEAVQKSSQPSPEAAGALDPPGLDLTRRCAQLSSSA